MLPIKYTSGDRSVICPYDKTHVILAKGLNAHLIKCRQNHTNVSMVVCRFDKTHVIPRPEKVYHESECPSQYLLDRERQRNAGDFGLRGDVKGPPIVPDHNSALDLEDWSACQPTRNPALFNKKEPEESVLHPFEPSGTAPSVPVGSQGGTMPSSLRSPPNSLPQTSSMAASVAPLTVKAKQFPSSVFEYTSGYGRGRGKVVARGKGKSSPNKANIKSPPPKTTPASRQFEDKPVDRKPTETRARDGNNSAKHEIPNDQHPALQQSNEGQLKLLKEGEKQFWHKRQQLKLLHGEEQKKLNEEYQLHILQVENKFAEDQRLLRQRQVEQERLMEERFEQLMMSAAASVPTFPTYSYSTPPPGFGQSGIPSTSSDSDAGVSNETSAAALPVKEEEEAWHEDTSDMNFHFGTSNSHNNAISVTTSGTIDNVAKWLQRQSIDDIDDHKSEEVRYRPVTVTLVACITAGKEVVKAMRIPVLELKRDSKNFEVKSSLDSKTKRKLEKKLRQIIVLEQKVSLGHKISQLEEEKLNQKAAIISQLTTLD